MIKDRKGFTLAELMIAIAIVALIAVIVVPAFQKARRKTRVETGISNLKTIFRAMQLYHLDTGKAPGTLENLGDYVKIDTGFEYELNPEWKGE